LAVATERLVSTQRAVEEQRQFLVESRRQLEDSFKALAASALKGSSEQFLSLAEQRLKSSQTEAAADLEERRTAIEAMLKPLGQTLDKLESRNAEMEKARAEAYSQLDEQIRALSAATTSLADKATALSTTLRGSSGKGRWGELALRNIVELAGLTEHVDFEEQKTTEDGGRPDMTVRLPGDRLIAIDAKAPINAYLEAREATNDAKRAQALDRHVRALKGHIKTLVALLRTVAIYWQQRALAENAAEIASVAGMLYERAAKFGEEFAGVGKGLQGALDAYNRAVGSFDHRLIPMARRLEEMKVTETTRRKLDTPKTVDEPIRLPRE